MALNLGMTVRELLERIDSSELTEWMAYGQLEPIPDPWYQSAIICSTMSNLWSKARRRPEDFMPRARRRRQSAEEQLAVFQAIAAAQNAHVKAGSPEWQRSGG